MPTSNKSHSFGSSPLAYRIWRNTEIIHTYSSDGQGIFPQPPEARFQWAIEHKATSVTYERSAGDSDTDVLVRWDGPEIEQELDYIKQGLGIKGYKGE